MPNRNALTEHLPSADMAALAVRLEGIRAAVGSVLTDSELAALAEARDLLGGPSVPFRAAAVDLYTRICVVAPYDWPGADVVPVVEAWLLENGVDTEPAGDGNG